MRPTENIKIGNILPDHKAAKPDLIAKMGNYCCYCEQRLPAQSLHVEHIKPKALHPLLEKSWPNFLLACTTCNSYKKAHQKNRQAGILITHMWPHIDNTISIFDYSSTGTVKVNNRLTQKQSDCAKRTLDMVGLIKIPQVNATYKQLGLDYDSISKRATMWGKIQTSIDAYLNNPTAIQKRTLTDAMEEYGYFSIWYTLLVNQPQLRNDLITILKAAQDSFDANGDPIPRPGGKI